MIQPSGLGQMKLAYLLLVWTAHNIRSSAINEAKRKIRRTQHAFYKLTQRGLGVTTGDLSKPQRAISAQYMKRGHNK